MKSPKSPQNPKKILRLRNELYDNLEKAIDGHEKKMTYIGFVMLFTMLGAILFFAWREELQQLFF
ncbi:MAG: hypothetical protein RI580_08760 [Halothece sp. Uz-M2-17]|nr:hypothetical protein [Halothece sp. Uz-M2-17]